MNTGLHHMKSLLFVVETIKYQLFHAVQPNKCPEKQCHSRSSTIFVPEKNTMVEVNCCQMLTDILQLIYYMSPMSYREPIQLCLHFINALQ